MSLASRNISTRKAKLVVWLLLVAAAPALASSDTTAAAGLAAFVSFGVGVAGGAVAGRFGWHSKRVFVAEMVAVLVLCALFLLVVRPQDFRNGYVEWFFITVLISILPLALCHYPAYAIARSLSPYKNRDIKGSKGSSGSTG